VLGTLRAGDGATPGADGGSITIEAGATPAVCNASSICSSASLIIAPNAIVQAGAGAAGAAGTWDAACACVHGGAGGAGGDLRLVALHGSAVALGSILPGAGGDGGSATATGIEPHAIGGTGGRAGTAILAVADEHAATVIQAPAGTGGLARASMSASCDPVTDPLCYVNAVIGKGKNGLDDTADPCDGNALLGIVNAYSPVPVGSPFGDGQDDSYDRDAKAGNGSAGSYEGGDGGTATARGCNNGDAPSNATDGHDGCVETCDGFYGTDGQNGAAGTKGYEGGTGHAEGGDGGPGLFVGGMGGTAEADGGQGGIGGAGGNGGRAATPCSDGGDGGQGGPGGDGGDSDAHGGRGGDAALASPIGHGGPGGPHSGSWGPGGAGGPGGDGGKGGGGFGIEPFNCDGSDGDPGLPGAQGQKGYDTGSQGPTGNTGSMSLQDYLEDLTNIDVDETVDECSHPPVPVQSSSMAVTLGCQDTYVTAASLVANLERAIGCDPSTTIPDCGPIVANLEQLEKDLVNDLTQDALDAETLVLDCWHRLLDPSLPSPETLECSYLDGAYDCLNEVDATCKTLFDLARYCATDAQHGGSTACGDEHDLLATATTIVTQCVAGRDPMSTTACSTAHNCTTNVVSCSGLQNVLRAACGDDSSESCVAKVTTAEQAALALVLSLVDKACGSNNACVQAAVNAATSLVNQVLESCQASAAANDCKDLVLGAAAIVLTIINEALQDVWANCDQPTTSTINPVADNPCTHGILLFVLQEVADNKPGKLTILPDGPVADRIREILQSE
jgi:hypothetical protein